MEVHGKFGYSRRTLSKAQCGRSWRVALMSGIRRSLAFILIISQPREVAISNESLPAPRFLLPWRFAFLSVLSLSGMHVQILCSWFDRLTTNGSHDAH